MTLRPLLAAALAILGTFTTAFAADPVVSNLTAAQRPGTKLVDITYDVTADTPAVKVTLELSADGGNTWTVPITATNGDIGPNIAVGIGKVIVWDAGVDWNNQYSGQIEYRLTADDGVLPVSFSFIPAGPFTMGRTSGDTDTNAPPVTVNVSAFHMGKYEVTKAEWDEVRTWGASNGYTDLPAGRGKASNHPVDYIDWYAMVKWCNARSQKEGLQPVYTVSSRIMKTGTTVPSANWFANGYRLPTEAEWEKAARGGISGKRFPWGTDTITHDEANYQSTTGFSYDTSLTRSYNPTHNDGTEPYTSPVGSFAANEYGFHDMAGNVSEMCWDRYGSDTYKNNTTDPRGATSGTIRVSRGGDWYSDALNCRVAYRYLLRSTDTGYIGFRVASSSASPEAVGNAVTNSSIDTRNWTLVVPSPINGTISGTGSYLSGTNATLTATTLVGYLFGSWIGDATGTTNPLTLIMDSDKTVGATFVEDTRDPDSDGLTNYQEIITYRTNPELADTDGDSISDGAEIEQGRDPLVSEPVVSNLTAAQRPGTKLVDITYDVRAETPTVKVTLEISSDGGTTYSVPVTSAMGALGSAVTVGTGKTITWNAGVDWDGKFTPQTRFRVVADDRQIPGFAEVEAGNLPASSWAGAQGVDAFYMAETEVTWSKFQTVRDWAAANGYDIGNVGEGTGPNCPVTNVSWYQTLKWCNAASEKEGLQPAYKLGAVAYRTGDSVPTIDTTANGYRLPSEKQWEFAARGGVKTNSYEYSGSNDINAVAWHDLNSSSTEDVATKQDNELGLFDMSGNVWEWSYDALSPRRVVRGGGWSSSAGYCRVASRDYVINLGPGSSFNDIGFRLTRSPVPTGSVGTAATNNSTIDTRDWTLDVINPFSGVASGAGSYSSGTNATITAMPAPGYLFGFWTGDATGSTNPLTLLMDSDKTVGANFVEDTRDPDADGLSNYQEIITYGTDPELADTDGDGIGDGGEIAQGRSPLVSEPVVSNLTAAQRPGTKLVDITYDVTSDTPTVKVTLEISSDGGATWAVPVTSVSGAIGSGVTAGTGKSITWNAGVDWDGKYSPQTRFRLAADNRTMIAVAAGLLPASSWEGAQNVDTFSIGRTEVTWAEFETVRTWAAANGYDISSVGTGTGPNHPVTNVNWYHVLKWCNARSEKDGLSPVYKVGTAVYRIGNSVPTVDPEANGYRLPSEKEWEFAARGGVKTNGYEYSGSNDINVVAWYSSNSGSSTRYVATKQANELGISDMSGNLWEWCFDAYASGSVRVVRGGGWDVAADRCRVAERGFSNPHQLFGFFGFRVALNSTNSGTFGTASTVDQNLDTRNWTVSITGQSNGSVSGAGSYLSGTNATLTATPSAGYLFGSWSGDASGSTNPTSVLMNANKAVGATFVQDTRDPDSDGLTNYQEIIVRLTNPNLPDTDGDGVNDGQEVTDGTNPLVTDSDSDGLNDGDEKTRGTNPLVADTDGDTYSDGYEVQNSSDPKSSASFPTYTLTLTNNGTATGGSFSKAGTLAHGTNATVTATPSAGYLFGSWSGNASGSSNPLTLLMNGNKTVGASFVQDTRDPDADGLTNYHEIIVRLTNPNVADTDGDGVNDGEEVTDGTNPLVTDSDGDGLSDGDEKTQTTDPLLTDTDGDGYSDNYEVQFSTNPKLATSVPTFLLNLTNNGAATGGSFSKAGTLAHGTNAHLTATPLPGYLFSSWTGDASGSTNPLTLLMDSDKTLGATFVEDTRDPDSDGLTNYQEIIVRLTNPNLSDTDDDGVNDGQEVTDGTNPLVTDSDSDGLSDVEEKARGTNPLSGDSDGDGLGDLQEEVLTTTNPLSQDSDGNGIADAYEDPDQDGILNGREVNERGTNPKSADSDNDGLSDTYELVFKGTTDAFKPRIGDSIRFDLRELGFQGTYKLVGKLPVGMTFNATTSVLEGKLTGKPATSALTIQILEGATVVRSIQLSLPVGAFPTTLTGSWQALLEDANGLPQGLVTATLSSPGKWSATLDVAGSTTIRKTAGIFDLDPAATSASMAMSFPAATGLSTQTLTLGVSGPDALASGVHPQGTMRGFRLARGAELPTATKAFTMVIDQGEQDGFLIPAGIGWATGVISTKGSITLSGQLGDTQAIKGSMKLGATGQALLWLKPYRNLSSRIGGVVSLHETGGVPDTALAKTDRKLWWYREADTSELSYGSGFGPVPAEVGVRSHAIVTSSAALATALDLSQSRFRNVIFDGGGLPEPAWTNALPEAFVLDASFNLAAVPIPGRLMAPWQGSVNPKIGSFSGSLDVAASTSGIIPGKAAVSGVLFPSAEVDTVVGAGLVKIPVAGKPGAFRTGAVVLSR